MAFNQNYAKGSSMNQIQYALHYWMNALKPAEEVEAMKKQKEEERHASSGLSEEPIAQVDPVERPVDIHPTHESHASAE